MKYDTNIKLTNKQESYSFTQVARQANGAVLLKSHDAVLLATIVVDETQIVEDDFLPLTVQYIEKSYAAGKIPGGFFKRESKPSDFETLTSRIIDRSLRPIFPKGFGYQTQITVMVLSADKDSDLQVLALNAASAALFVSDIDISQPVSALRIAKIDDKIIFNPTMSELSNSTLDLFLSGTKDDILMIEMCAIGSTQILSSPMIDPLLDPALLTQDMQIHKSNIISEDELIKIIAQAQDILKDANILYLQEFKPFCKEIYPLELKSHIVDEEMVFYISTNHLEDIKTAIKQMAKSERSTALRKLRKKIMLNKPDWCELLLKNAIASVKTDVVRGMILKDGIRADGRALNEIRPITILTNILPSAHSSCLFTRGQTQALVALTVGGSKDAQMYENLTDDGTKNESFMVHYNFPGFAVGEASSIGAPRRRELGHGNLAKRALEPIIDLNGETIRLVSEILESNGSSSMATVCGGYMALRAANIKTSDTIAGIAMGMVGEHDKHFILSDIMGLEDHDGDMDFKVTGSKNGITAMQMDIKLGGVSLKILKKALYQAKEGRSHIIDIMDEAVKAIEFNDGVLPVSHIFHIDPGIIGSIIGQAGKTIREIIEKFEIAIDIDKKSGKVKLSGTDASKIDKAKEHINTIASSAKQNKVEYKIGDIVDGTVKKIVDFGAFIEIPGGVDGLLHISKLSNDANTRVDKVSDVLNEGDKVKVQILEFKGNKIGLGLAKK